MWPNRRFLWICHLFKKTLMENVIVFAVLEATYMGHIFYLSFPIKKYFRRLIRLFSIIANNFFLSDTKKLSPWCFYSSCNDSHIQILQFQILLGILSKYCNFRYYLIYIFKLGRKCSTKTKLKCVCAMMPWNLLQKQPL